MQELSRRGMRVLLFGLLAASVAIGVSSADEPRGVDAALQGKWSRQVKTPNGTATVIKEHRADKTILTAYDDQQRVLYAHESTFECETSGKVKIFTILERRIIAGPNAGQATNEKSQFVYRIVNDKFIEVRGILEADANPPGMIVWDRVKEDNT